MYTYHLESELYILLDYVSFVNKREQNKSIIISYFYGCFLFFFFFLCLNIIKLMHCFV